MPPDVVETVAPTTNSAPDAGGQSPGEPPTGTPPASGTESAAGAPPADKAEGGEPGGTPREGAIAKTLQRREAQLVQRELALKEQRTRDERDFGDRVQAEVRRHVEAAFKEFDADPVGFAKKRGLDENALAGRLLNKNRETPEEIANKALARAQALEKQLLERDQTQARTTAEREYLSFVTKNETDFPHLLDEWTPEEIVQETHKLVFRIQKKAEAEGRKAPLLEDRELAEYLDGVAKSRQARRVERSKARGTAPATEGSEKAAPPGATKAASAPDGQTGKPATKTLNGKLSGERQTVTVKDTLEMTDEELRAEIEREVAKAKAVTSGKA